MKTKEIDIPVGYDFREVVGSKVILEHVGIKPAEERFLKLIEGLLTHFDKGYPGSLFFMRDGKVIFEFYNGRLCVNHKSFWSVFERDFGMDYTEIQTFIKNMVEKHFKMRGVIPQCCIFQYVVRWESISK